ncbi:MAG: M23 family metallopeptidase [Clostridia bacterium]|nr:M23 family metallopeptidase [Clostridia bacterium]
MEKLITDEERIRRAEDLVERRRNHELRISSENFEKRNQNNMTKKLLLQILFCLIIYCGFLGIKRINNDGYRNIKKQLDVALEYDIDFRQIYGNICEQLKKINFEVNQKIDSNTIEQNGEENNNAEESINENAIQDSNIQEENANKSENNIDGTNVSFNEKNESGIDDSLIGIGGGNEENEPNGESTDEAIHQMSQDADYIKLNYKLTKPLNEYVITSKFGVRASNELVSANHKGIDLGAITGTEIFSSLDGDVIEANSSGDYGKHIKVQKNDLIIVYAHCNKLFVKEGDSIKQGQKIAEVGSTGKATGPHLHFEIRRCSRSINPELIMEF